MGGKRKVHLGVFQPFCIPETWPHTTAYCNARQRGKIKQPYGNHYTEFRRPCGRIAAWLESTAGKNDAGAASVIFMPRNENFKYVACAIVERILTDGNTFSIRQEGVALVTRSTPEMKHTMHAFVTAHSASVVGCSVKRCRLFLTFFWLLLHAPWESVEIPTLLCFISYIIAIPRLFKLWLKGGR